MRGWSTRRLSATNDKIYVGAPKVKGNMLFEYQHSGRSRAGGRRSIISSPVTRAANDTNSFIAPGYNLFDLGARYTSHYPEQTGHVAPGGGQCHRPALLVDDRAEQSDRRQYRQSACAPRFAAHRAGLGRA